MDLDGTLLDSQKRLSEENRAALQKAADAGVEVQILETLSAGEDHPIRLSFPESEYLKGYILRVIKK